MISIFSVSASSKMSLLKPHIIQYLSLSRRDLLEKLQKEGGDRGFLPMLSRLSKSSMIPRANPIRLSHCLGGRRHVTRKRQIQKEQLQYFLGFCSAGEGPIADSIHSTVRDLLALIFTRCIKIEQSIWYVTESIYVIVAILMIHFQNSLKSVIEK